MAANDQSKISFFPSLNGLYHDSQLFLVLSTEMTFVTPVASGAAGRANVGLCSASSLLTFSELFLLLLSLIQLYFTIAID